jgi:hypothetical protein
MAAHSTIVQYLVATKLCIIAVEFCVYVRACSHKICLHYFSYFVLTLNYVIFFNMYYRWKNVTDKNTLLGMNSKC